MEYSLSFCLFIIIDVNRCRWKHPPVFIYLRKWVVDMCFRFEYSVSICLFIIIDVNRTRCKRPPVFVYLCKTVCWHVLLLWILISLFISQSNSPSLIGQLNGNKYRIHTFRTSVNTSLNVSWYVLIFTSNATGNILVYLL